MIDRRRMMVKERKKSWIGGKFVKKVDGVGREIAR